MVRKDVGPSQNLNKDSSESQPQNTPATTSADITDGEIATTLDVADDDMDIEQLAMDVFNNMKSMLVTGRSNKESSTEETQSSGGEVMLLESTERPTKSTKQLVLLLLNILSATKCSMSATETF